MRRAKDMSLDAQSACSMRLTVLGSQAKQRPQMTTEQIGCAVLTFVFMTLLIVTMMHIAGPVMSGAQFSPSSALR